jgi:hypothetical protein
VQFDWLKLVVALIPVAEAVIKAVSDAQAAGKPPADTHQTIADHLAELPGKIRA